MKISEILKSLRTENGLTQQELSERLNIGQATIACYENGHREPQIQILLAYADYFECTLDYLVGRTDELGYVVNKSANLSNVNALSAEERLFLKKLRKLNKSEKIRLDGYLDGLSN